MRPAVRSQGRRDVASGPQNLVAAVISRKTLPGPWGARQISRPLAGFGGGDTIDQGSPVRRGSRTSRTPLEGMRRNATLRPSGDHSAWNRNRCRGRDSAACRREIVYADEAVVAPPAFKRDRVPSGDHRRPAHWPRAWRGLRGALALEAAAQTCPLWRTRRGRRAVKPRPNGLRRSARRRTESATSHTPCSVPLGSALGSIRRVRASRV